MPAVVTDAVPSRKPLVTNGFSGSFGIAFLLHVIAGAVERLLRDLAGDAERPQVDQHQVVVGAARHDAEALVGERVGERARVRPRRRPRTAGTTAGSPRGTRPPWPRSRASAGRPATREHRLVDRGRVLAARQRIAPARGPRSVLCVVNVTTSAYGTGDGCAPPATRPAMCAASTSSSAPTSSAIARNASKSMIREYAVAPAMIMLRALAHREVADLVVVEHLGRRRRRRTRRSRRCGR